MLKITEFSRNKMPKKTRYLSVKNDNYGLFFFLFFRKECLCCFQHIDFVTAICFHPRQDQYFLSGSLDGKLRLWNIPDKKVALWNEVSDGASKLITTANFIQVRKNFLFFLCPSFSSKQEKCVPIVDSDKT